MDAKRRKLVLDYLVEYRLGEETGQRRRNVGLQATATVSDLSRPISTHFGARNAYVLEERIDADKSEGCWQVSALRVQRRVGSPCLDLFPDGSELGDATPETWACAKRNRTHHYFRATSSLEACKIIQLGWPVSFATEVTPNWYNPPGGIIEAGPREPDIRGSHCVSLLKLLNDGQRQRMGFLNSWGERWGDRGWGYISKEYFEKFIIDAWIVACPSHVAPLRHSDGIVCLEWKWSLTDSIGVHGREIVDAKSHERLAWAFCVRRDQYLDVDEFFVWPEERGKGYGRCLAMMVRALSEQTKCPIRTWVSFADTEENSLPAAEAAARLLGVDLGESPVQWAHLCGIHNPLPRDPSRRRPIRPASIMEWLRPKDELPAEEPIEYDVYFGTNRKQALQPEAGFLNERGTKLAIGRCRVRVPKTHRFGSHGTKWLTFFRRTKGGRLELLKTEPLSIADFFMQISNSEGEFDCKPQNLLYVHGYNVSFGDAMTQAAQFGVDLKIPGKTFVYSWPSAGSLTGYAADEAAIEASLPFLETFVGMVRSQRVDVPLNVLVHSMGSRAIVRLLAKLANDTTCSEKSPIGQVIFAAPDVDREVFADTASQFAGISKRTTMYATRADAALHLSEWLHKYPRAGLAPPILTAQGIDTVLVEDFDLFSLGHDYCSKASPVLHDMFHLIRYDSSPNGRPAIRQAKSTDGRTFWKLSLS